MRRVTLVIADDQTLFRQILVSYIDAQGDGFEVVGEATNGREAVELVTKFNPRVAVLDVAMPEMGGVEATLRIKKVSPHTAVLALSQYEDHEALLSMFQAGADGYATKNSDVEELFKAIRTVAEGQRYLGDDLSDTVITNLLDLQAKVGDAKSSLDILTERELEVVTKLAEGHKISETARRLGISPKTVESHKANIFRKLGLDSNAALVKWAIKRRLVPEEP